MKGIDEMSSQNIEIEFKNMVTEQEFHNLMTHFQLQSSDFFRQENHYFDTIDFSLKKSGCALRIREKKDGFEMTLKQPHSEGLLETNEKLNKTEAQSLLNGSPVKDGIIKDQLLSMNIDSDQLLYFGSLVTERAELSYQNGLLVLDFSTYLNAQDFEVEYEVANREKGEIIFLNLLDELGIPIRKSKNKVKRFYERKMELGL